MFLEFRRSPYDIREVITRVVDDGEFLEVQPDFAGNITIGFARLDGRPVGIIGNNPVVLAGVLDIDSPSLDRFSAEDQAGIEGLCATYCGMQSGHPAFL